MIFAAGEAKTRWLSHSLIKAINFHAIVGLHDEAGVYRSSNVTVGEYIPPHHSEVQSLMNDFVEEINESWASAASTELGAYALWRINNIHPFVNGNGRTARAVCYFIICAHLGGELPGAPALPELLRQERAEYVRLLRVADLGDRKPLSDLVNALLSRQLTIQ